MTTGKPPNPITTQCDICGHRAYQHARPGFRATLCVGKPPSYSDLLRCNCDGFRFLNPTTGNLWTMQGAEAKEETK